MPSPEEIADVLEKAADVIQTVGWCQHADVKRNNDKIPVGYCAIGAIENIVPSYQDSGTVNRLYLAVVDALNTHVTGKQRKTLSYGFGVVRWNDTEGRKADEVIEAMLHTAKELRNNAV